tara:strand:+ start:69 stop:578 length:510 start_codon:yes stop_codon:yes gene_type:complete
MPLPKHEDLIELRSDSKIFIETGSFTGVGIQKALDAGFTEIYSCELMKKHYDSCMDRFSDNDNVSLYLGSSEDFLPEILEKVDQPFVLWLDAHGGYQGVAGEPLRQYLPKEFEVLSNYSDKLNNSVIMVDDANQFLNDQEFTSKVEESLKKIKPNSTIEYYENRIIICK